HSLAGEVDVVPPIGRVERRSVEAVEPRYRWRLRDRELPAGGQEDIGLVGAGARLEQPLAPFLVPTRPLDLRAGADSVEHFIAPGNVLEVRLDLRLGRVAA